MASPSDAAMRSDEGFAGLPEHLQPLNLPVVPRPPSFQPRPWRCPICNGRGHVPADFYTAIGFSASMNPVMCKSCGGRGVIVT